MHTQRTDAVDFPRTRSASGRPPFRRSNWSALALVVISTLASAQPSATPSLPGLRLGVGADNVDGLRADVRLPMPLNDTQAWVLDGWVGESGALGARASFHWLAPKEGATASGMVRKAFVGLDQNRQRDRKLTLGLGGESPTWFWGAYVSGAWGDDRTLAQTPFSSTELVTGTETVPGLAQPVPFEQTVTRQGTRTLTERAFDTGVGLRLGRHVDDRAIKLTTGLDIQQGEGSVRQASWMVAAEKAFGNTPHSLELRAELVRRSGTGGVAQVDDQHRVMATYRYQFGHQPRRSAVAPASVPAPVAVVQARAETPPPAPPQPPAPVLRRQTVVKHLSLQASTLFRFNSADLSEQGRQALAEVATELRATPANRADGAIQVTGHTCDIGSTAFNQRLSERRARAVQVHLAQISGLPASVFVVQGLGESSPAHPNVAATRALNRRVELSFHGQALVEVDVLAPPAAPPAAPVAPVVAAAPAEPPAPPSAPPLPPVAPSWVDRAMASPVDHLQRVDTYRLQRVNETLSFGPKQHPPVAQADTVEANNSGLQGFPVPTVINVLGNDVEVDGENVTLTSVSAPANGVVTIDGNQVVYTPAPGFFGTDTFNYVITDASGRTSNGQVVVNVVAFAPVVD